jgi:DNA repair exonuclease SbcCD ATPase subunit
VATGIQLRQSQWFYDDAGYYSYVLLNASEDQFKSIQQVLRSNGLRVLLADKSYRPASNGVQYQWYIRVSDESGRRPTQERVRGILAPYALAEVPAPELKELRDRVAAQEEEIGKLKATLNEKERLYQVVVQRLESIRKQNQELQAIYEKTQAELREYRQKVHRLELRLRQIQETALKPEDVAQLRQDYEDTIQSLKQELERKESELTSWISDFGPEIQEREQRIADLENQLLDLRNKIAVAEEEKKRLIDQFQERRATREVELEKGNPEYLFREMLALLLPNVEFLAGSFDTLWREMQDPIGVLRDLTGLAELKAKRVRRAEEWMERHIEGEWRLYYRKCEDSRYQVLISHKNAQEADIDWLRRQ